MRVFIGFVMARNRTFRFLSWNVRGLNNSAKCISVRSFIKNSKCCVVCFQETKLSSISSVKLRSFCGFVLCDFRALNAVGSRGGILTAWNPSLFECVGDWCGSYSLHVLLKRHADGRELLISNFYGPTTASPKVDLFRELHCTSELAPAIWLALGDFNVLYSLQDKNGMPSNVSEIVQFRNAINEAGLLDIPLLNRSFTWSNGRVAPTLERLNRAFISDGWTAAFPNSSLRALPRPRSDHCPLVVSALSFLPSAHLFRFEAYWLRLPGISEVVSNA